MLPRLNHGEGDAPADAHLVTDTALTLEIREFDLFRLAFRFWHGAAPDEKRLERVFVAYMFQQRVPPWVRHYCREALDAHRAGRPAPGLDPATPRRPRVVFPGRRFVGVAGLAALALIAVLQAADVKPDAAPLSCHGGGPGLRFFEEMARGLAGHPEPIDCKQAGLR